MTDFDVPFRTLHKQLAAASLLPPHVEKDLSSSDDEEVLKVLAANASIAFDTQARLLARASPGASTTPSVRIALTKNWGLDATLQNFFVKHGNFDERTSLACNPALSLDLRQRLPVATQGHRLLINNHKMVFQKEFQSPPFRHRRTSNLRSMANRHV